jgi:hypothetical protein
MSDVNERDKLGGVGHNFMYGSIDRGAVKRSARIAVQNMGQTQALHDHKPGERCGDGCYIVTLESLGEG